MKYLFFCNRSKLMSHFRSLILSHGIDFPLDNEVYCVSLDRLTNSYAVRLGRGNIIHEARCQGEKSTPFQQLDWLIFVSKNGSL